MLKSSGGFLMALKNFEGDVLSDLVRRFRSVDAIKSDT